MLQTTKKRTDGFGAQYQGIIIGILYSELHGNTFVYRPIEEMEHNYNNDPDFLTKIENIMNLKSNYPNINSFESKKIEILNSQMTYRFFENKINKCLKSLSMLKIKKCYWQNKEKSYYKNDKINIAVHIRRRNPHDTQLHRIPGLPKDEYYIKILKKIRKKYKKKEFLIHIYSQGDINSYKCFDSPETIFHIDESITDTFHGLVSAEVLVTSESSLSYIAAILSEGEIYYKTFWHKPAKHWIVNK